MHASAINISEAARRLFTVTILVSIKPTRMQKTPNFRNEVGPCRLWLPCPPTTAHYATAPRLCGQRITQKKALPNQAVGKGPKVISKKYQIATEASGSS